MSIEIAYLNFDDDPHAFYNPSRILLLFAVLHYISGCHRSVHRYTLLPEFGFTPYQVQYTRLWAHSWNKSREDAGLSGKQKNDYTIFPSWLSYFLDNRVSEVHEQSGTRA
jgi:hypothetical protein